MGFMDKVKKILFDEDVVEVPVDELPRRVKKEEKSGFIDYHNDEEDEKDPIKEVIIPKEEEKEEKKIPSYLDDDFINNDFPISDNINEEIRLTKEDSNKSATHNINDFYTVPEKKEFKEIKDYRKMLNSEPESKEKKPFKNTPVISPVWGILDKNYKPEEIVDKTEAMVKLNTGATPRSFGPVSYNDEPLPKVKVKENPIKEDIIEINTTISELIDEPIEDTSKNLNTQEITIDEEPKHSIADTLEDDEVIATTNYDDYEDIASGIENETPAHTDIEDAFESTSEFNRIASEDISDDEEEPLVDLNSLINKDEKDNDPDDDSLDNTIETDLFNLIDSMYKDDEVE